MTRSETNNPLVSICIPTYNYAHYLPQAISSCLNQSYGRIEIIITDDASTDNSREVISSFDDPRIRFAENPVRLGLVENWNRALSLVRGEVVKFLFADDYLEENAVERMVAALDNPGVSLVFSSAKIIDAQGAYTRIHQPYSQSGCLGGRDEAKRCLKEGNYIGAPTAVAVRRSTLEEVGKFNEVLRFHGDQEMWIRLLLKGDAYYFSEPLVSVRQHEGSETGRLEREKQTEIETIKFLTCCLQNEEIRSLLSKSDVKELTDRCKNLEIIQSGGDLIPGSYWERYKARVKGVLRARTPPYLIEAFHPVYKKLISAYQKIQGAKD
jgi:glycosyltransferase involved in cell wall biosynthesis